MFAFVQPLFHAHQSRAACFTTLILPLPPPVTSEEPEYSAKDDLVNCSLDFSLQECARFGGSPTRQMHNLRLELGYLGPRARGRGPKHFEFASTAYEGQAPQSAETWAGNVHVSAPISSLPTSLWTSIHSLGDFSTPPWRRSCSRWTGLSSIQSGSASNCGEEAKISKKASKIYEEVANAAPCEHNVLLRFYILFGLSPSIAS